MAFDFKNEAEVKDYLNNIGIEYRFGCYSEKNPEVCHLLGMYFDVIKNDIEQAKKVYKVNCDSYKWSFSCYKYGYLLDKENKPENVDNVIHYLNQGCEAGLAKSCYFASVRMGAKAEKNQDLPDRESVFQKSLELMNKACTEGVGRACFNLSSIHYLGLPAISLKKDLTKVLEYSIKGCDNMHVQACVNTSLMYSKGEGTPKNEKLAKVYEEKARELHKQMTAAGVKFEESL
ncbi:hypothetical protein V9T40_004841 [Parthenolecanium corni]|uniref:Cytochrome c oxidase assembly factor 7 homolog n=1 Tax=Parthenolecanium corni TaxID=536013 RepID=A0AAN9Y3N4_9HEMI